MPFVSQDVREMLDAQPDRARTPGEKCYVHYRKMVNRWKANPCWTTAHQIYKEFYVTEPDRDIDDEVAYDLAWQVFFQWYVVPYEREKETLNGPIE